MTWVLVIAIALSAGIGFHKVGHAFHHAAHKVVQHEKQK